MIRRFVRVPKLLKIAIILLALLLSGQNLAFAAVEKSVIPVPPDTEINPGDDVYIRISVPRETAEIRNPANIMLVMDRTGSMRDDWGGKTKMQAAKDALKAFVDLTDEDYDYVGLVTYDDPNYSQWDMTCMPEGVASCFELLFPLSNMTNANKTAIKDAIDTMTHRGNTSIGAAMYGGNQELITPPAGREDIGDYMILATDGIHNTWPDIDDPVGGKTPLQTAIDNEVTIYTVGIGAGVNEAYLQNIANQTGGKYLYSSDPADLIDDYEMIFGEIAATQYGFFDWLNAGKWDVNAPFEPMPADYLDDHLEIREGHCVNWVEPPLPPLPGTVITPLDYAVTEPDLGWIVIYLDEFETDFICIQIEMTVRDNAKPGPQIADKFGRIEPIDPFNPCNPVEDWGCWWDLIWGEDIGEGPFDIRDPAKPWLQTFGGDVGSRGPIDPIMRDLLNPDANAVGDDTFNADYLIIGDGGINPFFRSHRGWSVDSYPGGIDLHLVPDPTMYQTLWDKYTSQCGSETITETKPADIAVAAAGDCNILFKGGSFTIDGTWGDANPYNGDDPAVIFVEDQLIINNRLQIGAQTGLIFVVGSNISIQKNVTDIDGIFITDGEFNTNRGASCGSLSDVNSPLEINGAVYVFGQACFTRRLAENLDDPAEIINFEPKYLWLFQEPIGNSKVIYREVAP